MAEPMIGYTVAVATGATLAKRVTAKPGGSGCDVQGYDRGYWFRFEQYSATNLTHFGRQLQRLSKNSAAGVLRGGLKPHVVAAGPRAEFRRKSEDPDPAVNSLTSTPRYWAAIDADDVAAPAGKNWLDNVPDAASHLLKLMPPELRASAFIAQVTGSAGFSGSGLMRLRLWFALDEAVTDKELRRWADAWNTKAGTHLIDPSVYQPVQLHYTADPILSAGVADPTGGRRWYLVPGPDDRATLTIPAAAVLPTRRPNAGAAVSAVTFGHCLSRIGHPLFGFWKPINSAIGVGIARGVADKAIIAALRSTVLAADPGHRTKAIMARYADVGFLTREVTGIRRRDVKQREQVAMLRQQIFLPGTNLDRSP